MFGVQAPQHSGELWGSRHRGERLSGTLEVERVRWIHIFGSASLPVTFSPRTDMFTLLVSTGSPVGQGVTHGASPSAWHDSQPPTSQYRTHCQQQAPNSLTCGLPYSPKNMLHTQTGTCVPGCWLVWLSHTHSQKFVRGDTCAEQFFNAHFYSLN